MWANPFPFSLIIFLDPEMLCMAGYDPADIIWWNSNFFADPQAQVFQLKDKTVALKKSRFGGVDTWWLQSAN